ncbi:MAG: hypothetical protein JNJ57_10725 [Saprospiraceae bacterium]|nr:hypothetical protein [Saprospiraceae bacterium]
MLKISKIGLYSSLVALLLTLSTCRQTPPAPLTPAFYYWQTSLSLTSDQCAYLEQTACRKLYVKVLDIGLDPANGNIIPYTRLQIPQPATLPGLEYIPVVFITNETLKGISSSEIRNLAEKMAASQAVLPGTPHEFQVDCDWTPSTRTAFFELLGVLRGYLAAKTSLSATIRLHQYKFPEKTGVPPVDRGMLMCYNTGDIDSPQESNSIFSPDDAEKYIKGAPKHYPIPLDLALPAFGWTLVYRNEELWKIIPFVSDSLPSGELNKGTFQAGHYLRPGDVLRQEFISPELLQTATRLVAKTDLADDATLAFFHLDQSTPRNYPASLIRSVCQLADSIRTLPR